jgi:hypothetical protein
LFASIRLLASFEFLAADSIVMVRFPNQPAVRNTSWMRVRTAKTLRRFRGRLLAVTIFCHIEDS